MVDQIVNNFVNSPDIAWTEYLALPDWSTRENVALRLAASPHRTGYANFIGRFRQKVKPYVRESFYEIFFNEEKMQWLINEYELKGSIELPFLKTETLGMNVFFSNSFQPGVHVGVWNFKTFCLFSSCTRTRNTSYSCQKGVLFFQEQFFL